MSFDFVKLATMGGANPVSQEDDKPWYSDAYEVGRQAAAGVVVDLPRMAGQAARWVAQDGSEADEWGRRTVESADERAAAWEPDLRGRGGLAETLIKGARAVGPMAPAIAAGFVPGGQWVAPAVAAAQFGASSAQDTEDKLRQQGISDEDATAAGWRTGLIQGPAEGIATAAGGWLLKGAKPLLGIGSQTTASVASRLTDTAVLKPLAKGMGLNLLVQPATEVAQDLGTEFNERSYGAAPEDAWQIAKDSAQGGLGLTLLLGPFAAGGQVSRSRRAQALKDALYSPTTPEDVRAQARDLIVAEAEKQKVSPEDMDSWLDEQFMADDARFEREDAYIQEKAQGLYDSRLRERAAQNKQDVIDIRALMPDRQAKAVISTAPSESSTSTPEVAQALESHKEAQAQREIAATQSVAPPTPEQIEEEAAAQQQVQLAQDAMAFVQQAGIQAKNALPVVKEMLSAGDIVTPALRGAMRGALVTGDVNGARKMLVDAKKARDKAEVEAQKAQAAAQKAEQKIVEEGQKFEKANDEFAASIVARQTPPTEGTPANVPSPAQPGTQTSQAQSAQGTQEVAKPVEKTLDVSSPGAKIVSAFEARSGKKMSDVTRRRIFLRAGFDETGFPSGMGKMSLQEVADAEAVMTGKTKAVVRETIRKDIASFGLTEAMVDAIVDFDYSSQDGAKSAIEQANEDVVSGPVVTIDNSEEGEGRIVERESADTNTPELTDGDYDSESDLDAGAGIFDKAMPNQNTSENTLRVRDNLGVSAVEDRTSKASAAYTKLDLAKQVRESFVGPVQESSDEIGLREVVEKLAKLDGGLAERFAIDEKTGERIATINDKAVDLVNNLSDKIARYYLDRGYLQAAASFAGGRLYNSIEARLQNIDEVSSQQTEATKRAEQERAAENARIAAKNEKLIAEMNREFEQLSNLNRELGHPDLINQSPRAAEEWAEIAVPEDGDLDWDALPVKQQAAWVRAFARWDNAVDDDSAYYRNFAEINDAARKATSGAAPKTGTGAIAGNTGPVGQGQRVGTNTATRAPGTAGENESTGVRAGDTGQAGQNVGANGARYIYAGSSAGTANNATRSEAERRLANGEDPEAVRKDTGWFKGKYDNKFRFELDDSEAQWVTPFEDIQESKLFDKATPLKLGDVLQHDALFEAYPELRDVAFVKRSGFLDFGGLQGSFDPKTMTLQVTPYAQNPLSTALHEIQHWVQTKEGFEQGGNESMALTAMSEEQITRLASQIIQEQTEIVAKAAKSAELLAKIGNMPELKAVWEATERFNKLAKKHPDPGNRERMDAYDALNKVKEAFRLAAFGKKGYFDLTYEEQVIAGRADSEDGYKRAGDDAVKAIMDGTSKIADVRSGDIDRLRSVLKNSSAAFDAYRRIAGEIEARDVQARQGMTADQRKETAPFSSEDIAVEDAVLASRSDSGNTTSESRTRNVVSLGNIKDNAGKQVAVIESTRADMERTPHIKAAFDKLRANGLGSVVDSIESWYVTENPVDWGGAYTVIDGKTAIVMSSHDMLVPSAGEHTMLHELGHAADKTHEAGGGLYSGMPEFNLRIVGNQIRGHGIVADQVIAFYETNPNSWFSKRMQYPLDRKAHGDLDAQGVREEMFAQLHATFNTPVGKEFLYDNLPDVAYFLENVNADIAQNDTAAEGLAGQTNAGAPSRFSQAKRGQEAEGSGVLATRPQGDRGQRASQEVTNSEAFKRWFGDSKVVDAGGKPLVVYHGTRANISEFMPSRFDGGIYFSSDSGEAAEFARMAGNNGTNANENIIPAYVAMKNPRTIDAQGAQFDEQMGDLFKAAIAAAKSNGNDGLIVRNVDNLGGVISDTYIAFRPEQIKSAIGNNGNFDARNPDIRFNRTRNIEAQLTPTARAAAGATKQFLKDVKDKSILWGAFTEDLINSISGKLPAAKKYLDLVKRGQVAKTRAERDIESILDRFATLSKVERGTGPSSVNAFLKESTTKKLWGYKPEYLDNVQVDPEMEARFKALSPEARALVQEVFRHGHENLQQLKSAVMGNINTEFDALIAGYEAEGDKVAADKERKAKQKALRDFQSLTALSGDWPYAPLKRFGNHVVVGKSQAYLDAEERSDTKELEKLRADENHYFVAFTETKREARALRAKIEGRYSDATNFEKDGVEYGSRDMLGAFRRLRTLVDDSKDDQLSGNAKRAMNRLMVDLHLTLLGEQSARQAERTRTGVAGADVDMMRAFATQGRASAHFIASLTNNGQIAEELRNLRNQADRFRGAEREGARDAYNEVLRRHAMGIDYRPTPFIDKALGANSVWMLLTSPAYFLTNATQPFVVSMPVLAGRNGYARSFAAMSKAYADIAPLIKDGTITQDDYSRMPADVKGIIEELANRGRIDISLEQDLGRWRSDQDSKLAVFGKVVDKMRGVAQTVESVNRVATAIAAARLAKQNGMTDEDATQYADEVIFTTHGDYSGFNAPRVMRSGIGRMMTQFRKFQLIQISMYAKLLNSAFKGAKPEERSAARWALGYSLTHMFILGGTLGMPGAQAIGWVLRQAFGDDDEPDNPEVTLRKMVPPALADLLVKGAPAALGVDLSGRLGAGNMLSLLPYADIELSRDGYQTAAMAAMGPFFGGLLPKFADGLGLITQGDYWKGMEQLVPKGLSDVSKAVRQSTEGITQRNGDIAMSADEVSFLASIGQAMGLPTTSLTERSMIASAKFKADEFFNQRTAQIKKDYVQAYRSGDNEALVEAREEWARTQEARKEYGYKVQPMSELLKAPQAQVKREANRAGGVPYKKDNEQFVRSMTQ